ncbi:DUF2252 domain-containing protein [Paraburkholderia sp. A3BS-1L]|uniref:DUF2252 domain-containing protein n=1 Tax=Paraburkholderia sp. A3BS-1L TaxID=3028375 RepID=UPI003DA9343E
MKFKPPYGRQRVEQIVEADMPGQTLKEASKDDRTESRSLPATHQRPRAERRALGKKLREQCPRDLHGVWKPAADRPDPVHLVEVSDKRRLPQLLALRHGRMALSPFTYYRGAALNMAHDLAALPATGVRVQCSGDAHLVNFGGFATAERNIIFSINDLDETLPGPWEWDLKRLAASVIIASRDNGLSNGAAEDAALACVRSYREHMNEYSEMNSLDLWYHAIETEALIASLPDPAMRRRTVRAIEKARESSLAEDLFPKLAAGTGQEAAIREQPPTLFHPPELPPGKIDALANEAMATYRESLTPAHRMLLGRFDILDAAIKVVGVGSVGTICWVVLLMEGTGTPLFLQVKEARASVLEAYAGRSVYGNHGQRVVNGHWLMQPASDIFLGWTAGPGGHHFYVRQLRDVKVKPAVENFGKVEMAIFAGWCGQSLALSHARSGDPAVISGYLGKSDAFDKTIAAFSAAYADQNEADHAALVRAIRGGRLEATVEEAE